MVVSYRFYNQPQLAPGTIAEKTLIAPSDAHLEDIKGTRARQEKVLVDINPILRRNQQVTAKILLNLSLYLENITQIRQRSGRFPVVSEGVLSLKTQQYLRSCPEAHWQGILLAIKNGAASEPFMLVLQRNPQFLRRIEQSRRQYQQAVGIKTFDPEINDLLAIADDNWLLAKTGTMRALKLILTQGIPLGIRTEHLEETIKLYLDELVPKESQGAMRSLLIRILEDKYNLEEDKQATEHLARELIQAVPPEIVTINKGEIIVQKGEKISQSDFVLIDHFGWSRRGINWVGIGLSGLLVSGSVGLFWAIEKHFHRFLRSRDYILLGLLSASPPLLAIMQFPYTNLSAIGLLTSTFYGPTLAVTQVLLLSGLSSYASGTISWDLIAGTAGGLVTALMAGRLRSRDELALLGGVSGLVQGGVYLVIYLIASSSGGTILYAILPRAFLYGLSALAWIIIALGLSPYLERFFDLVTSIRLVELANPNYGLLKRLATEAPGTFQHTLFVACLAEAAARKLRANVELVRAGTLYHDIGKMHDPLGFIENQMGQPNKHEQINDPWVSADIIKRHVSEGLVIARKYGLPRAIRDFIPEHQGTLKIAYFYHQAKQRLEKGECGILYEADFCYDGPIPQSRETAILMLADSSEAALRSLQDATPEQATDMIKKILQARWREQQLKESGLKYEELKVIAEVFVEVWQQYHHKRIAYPKAVLEPTLGQV